MKQRNREINIFNISMLDVISGALGAFLIIMVVLFPYYKKEHIDYREEIRLLMLQIESLQSEIQSSMQRVQELEAAMASSAQVIQDLQAQVETARQATRAAEQRAQSAEDAARQARQEAERFRERAEVAERELAKTFLLVYIRWDTVNQDVDLHVIDPSGAEFYFRAKTIRGRRGELSEDSQRGPGNELWEIHGADPGTYRIYANLFARHGNPASPLVKGRVIYRDGSTRLRDTRLHRVGEKVPLAVVTVHEDGRVSVR